MEEKSEAIPFRLQSIAVHLTYRDHQNKHDLKAFIDSLWPTKECYIAHEQSDESHPYLHTHAVIKWFKRAQSTNTRILDFNGVHPNINPIDLRTLDHWNNAVRYMGKEDPENSHLLSYGKSLATSVWNCETVQEALVKHCKAPSHAPGIIALFGKKEQAMVSDLENLPLLDWQTRLVEELNAPAGNRKVVWFFDKIGASGKTSLAKHLMVTDPRRFYVTNSTPSNYHFGTIVKNAIEGGWNPHGGCLFINLARGCVEKDIYQAIESIKDGLITATKYQGGTLVFSSPHVIVLSNECPNVGRLSKDRWDIRIIERNKENTASPAGLTLFTRRLTILEAESYWNSEHEQPVLRPIVRLFQ